MSSEIDTYFEQLRSHLHLAPGNEDDVVRELRTHVEDRMAEMDSAGLSERQALHVLLTRLDRPRVLARQFQEAYLQPSWNDGVIAAAAFLLVSALYATHLWSEPLAVVSVAAVIVLVTLYRLWQGRPMWFYPWAGLALTLLSICGYFAFVLLDRSAGLVAGGGVDTVSMLGLAGAALYFPLALFILGSCILVASRRDWLDASLMLSPSAPAVVWLVVLHQNGGLRDVGTSVAAADTALAASFLVMAGAVAMFVRVRTRTLKLATMIGTAAIVLVTLSSIYDAELSMAGLTARGILLLGFLLRPAILQTVLARPLSHHAGE